jgi:uncharacterized HAD superfamily protein
VDLDGTLTLDKNKGWNDKECLEAKPNLKMVEIVNKAWHDGHTIIIWTARRWSRREATVYWLQKNDIKYHALNMSDKPNVDYFIDDRAINARDLQTIKSVL